MKINDLKTKVILLMIFVVLFNFGCQDNKETTQEYQIGEIGPGGGYVFYDKGTYSDGWRYIEASSSDFSSSVAIEWGCFNKPVTAARSLEIGSGLTNSEAILTFHDALDDFYNNPSNCSSNSNGTVAAKICLDLVENGFSNWHLPSEKEGLLMYQNLHLQGMGNFIADGTTLYWTSTEHDDNTATAIDFSNGNHGWLCKQCAYNVKVRAVRYF